MGLRNMFRPAKELTPEESRQYLEDKGLAVRGGDDNYRQRRMKFGAFNQYAQDGAKGVPQVAPRMKGQHPGYQEFRGGQRPGSAPANGGYGGSQFGTQPGPGSRDNGNGSSGSYQPASQSSYSSHGSQGRQGDNSYGGYDPYAQTGDSGHGQQKQGGSSGMQTQVQKDSQSQHYDPYAQDDSATMETDFNQFPNADPQNVALQQEQEQQQEEELDPEEEEIRRIKGRTKNVRGATVKSSKGILRNLREADDTATNVMGTIGEQREKMYQMESDLNMMETQQVHLDGSVKRLEHYNRGLFHISPSNPFTKKSKKRNAEKKMLEQRQLDRDRDNRLNSGLHSSQQAILGQMKSDGAVPQELENAEMREKADYDKRVKAASTYLTDEHDEEDERMEVEYSRNMDEAIVYAQRLRSKANVIAEEIASQNKGLERISQKVNKVDDKVVLTTNRIRGI